jgi:hypothetical protein
MPWLVIAVVLGVASLATILYGILGVRGEGQVTFLEAGFVGAAIASGIIALGALRGMWRAASQARSGRALGLAIVAGLAALGTIGAVTVALVLALLYGV